MEQNNFNECFGKNNNKKDFKVRIIYIYLEIFNTNIEIT